MNKIVLDKKIKCITDDKIKVVYSDNEMISTITLLQIENTGVTDLYLDLKPEQTIMIDFKINYDINIYILYHGNDTKIKYNYHINNSQCNVYKYNQVSHINELVEINLDSEKSSINYIMKSIGNNLENYDYVINHNVKNTNSYVTNNCVNYKGSINIQTSGCVSKNITGCVCNQNNRIINLANNKCEIRPNLIIDCDDVDANHSALIGKFSDEEMFYLNSRGINDIDATNLLIKGFLLNEIPAEFLSDKISEDIDKYWR